MTAYSKLRQPHTKERIIYYLHIMLFIIACCLKRMINQLKLISLTYKILCIQ